MDKPKNIDEYKKWLQDELSITINSKTENHYNSIANKIKSDFLSSKVWNEILIQLNDYNTEYLARTNYQLLVTDFKPDLVTKSFDSFLEKTFRKNIVYNKNFPKPPYNGWITPNNWIENTNDILRTFFVVKYLDGVEFLMEKIQKCLKHNSLDLEKHFEARDEGYYAVHLYTFNDFDIPKVDWDTEIKSISIELQITTQLQEVIGKLTHQLYEGRRIKLDKADKKWQWDYESEEFTANYLGHILHYVEGMIMEVRNKQSKK
jgi:hypothetical protein